MAFNNIDKHDLVNFNNNLSIKSVKQSQILLHLLPQSLKYANNNLTDLETKFGIENDKRTCSKQWDNAIRKDLLWKISNEIFNKTNLAKWGLTKQYPQVTKEWLICCTKLIMIEASIYDNYKKDQYLGIKLKSKMWHLLYMIKMWLKKRYRSTINGFLSAFELIENHINKIIRNWMRIVLERPFLDS